MQREIETDYHQGLAALGEEQVAANKLLQDSGAFTNCYKPVDPRVYGDTGGKGGSQPDLPEIELVHPGTVQPPLSFRMRDGFDLESYKSPQVNTFKSGDQLLSGRDVQGRDVQQLQLLGGGSIHLNSDGAVSLFDKDNRAATVTEKRATEPGMFPELTHTTFSNGARISFGGGIGVIDYPGGTTVFFDSRGLRALERGDSPRVQLNPRLGSFDFRGFK